MSQEWGWQMQDLLRTLDGEPWLTLGAVADAHEEAGQQDLADAYRLIIRMRRIPRVILTTLGNTPVLQYRWSRSSSATDRSRQYHVLSWEPETHRVPRNHFGAFLHSHGSTICRSPSQAYESLAAALVAWRQAHPEKWDGFCQKTFFFEYAETATRS